MRRATALLAGQVQGVGLRPFVRRLATELGLAGLVRNEPGGVWLEVEGEGGALEAFFAALRARAPGAVTVASLAYGPPAGEPGFVIGESVTSGVARASLAPDLAPCAPCAAEVAGAGRRRRYPFTSCTGCGPRASIALSLPWDRSRTTMAAFTPCGDCAREYTAVDDRRSHAETIACPACGPTAWLEVPGGARLASGQEAVAGASSALARGALLALKGVGGWQLVCDATSEEAVLELRSKKGREAKPFAVLFASREALLAHAEPTAEELCVLEGSAAPIVLVRGRHSGDAPSLAAAVGPPDQLLGAMLPASPLHALLAEAAGRPLVCTSGNLSDEPLLIQDDEARRVLGPLVGRLLGHDRGIARPLDDSVLRVTARGPVLLRGARGVAPLALPRREPGPVVLALGAHLKTTVALALDGEIWVSAHVGDLGAAATLDRLESVARELLAWAGVRPDVIACDLHPELGSTRLAESLAADLGAEVVRVQHHAAHVAAVAAEHGLTGPLLGLAWDGMGLGEAAGDAELWGGEALELHGPEVRRVGHLRAFPLPGGERALREPRRAALGLLFEAGLPFEAIAGAFSAGELSVLGAALARGVHCPRTTSVGRLFDAVAGLLGVCSRSRYEAEAALALELAAAACADENEALELPVRGDATGVADWAPLVSSLLSARARGASVSALAASFHGALARAAGELAQRSGVRDVALAGGCFQNARLLDATSSQLEALGFRPWFSRAVPPGDGGLALGQALLASRRSMRVSRGAG